MTPRKINMINFETEVKPYGNGAHIYIDKSLVGKKVRVQLEVLDEE